MHQEIYWEILDHISLVFLLYTFGILAYLINLFFLFYSILYFIKKTTKIFFIRLFFFFISLILIPQIFLLNLNFESNLLINLTWGEFANSIYRFII